MCLRSTTGKKIAERDITCYKVLSYWNGKYYTPVMHKKVKDAVLTGRRLFRGGLFRQTYDINGSFTWVEGGYIHVYKKFNGVISIFLKRLISSVLFQKALNIG